MRPMSDNNFSDWVGPVLAGDQNVIPGILDAIRELNPKHEIIDRGGYIRVLCPVVCHLSRRTIEAKLNRPFIFPQDLELIMPSFKGQLFIDEDNASWESESE